MRHCLTLIRMAMIKKTTNNKCWSRCGEKGTLLHSWWECRLLQPLWRTVWRLLNKLRIKLPYDPAIPLLGVYLRKPQFKKAHALYATLFTIARTWKQPRCPSTDEWIKKLWYIYTVEYYSAIKRNKYESVVVKQMPVIQSKVSQKKKKYHILTHIYGI